MRQSAIFAATTAAIIAGVGILLGGVAFQNGDGHHAVIVSGSAAFVVQLVAFVVSWRLRSWNVMGAWGLGAVIRFAGLALYAILAIKVWALAPVPALVSFVIFLFLSTLAEPWLLRSPAPSR